MNIAKHMEAIFVIVLAFAGVAGFANAAAAPHVKAGTAAFDGQVHVVTVTAKRLH